MEKKSKLKGLFDEIDKKQRKGQGIKSEEEKYKTKPTKPNFGNYTIGVGNNQYKGLTNNGNICYSNVVMQCLVGLKEFTSMLKNVFEKVEDLDSIMSDYPIMYNLVKVATFYEIKNTSLATSHIKTIVNMFDSSGEQNDAHEFMVFLFDRLNDEMLKIDRLTGEDKKVVASDETEWEEVKKGGKRMKQVNTEEAFNISVIGKIFQGVLKHELDMKGKSVSKCTIEPFFILSLDFGENSIESCFKKFFTKRKIEDNNSSISQKSYFDKLPQVLIVHLKAFYYDKELKQIKKINKTIDYEAKLTLDKSYLTPSKVGSFGLEYDLISIIIHKGTKASEGHYMCFCKDDKGVWWNLDDSKILRVDEESVRSFRPYILFYRNIK